MSNSGKGLAIFGIILAIVGAGIGGYAFFQTIQLQSMITGVENDFDDLDNYVTYNTEHVGIVKTDPIQTWIEVADLRFSVRPRSGYGVLVIFTCQVTMFSDAGSYNHFKGRLLLDNSSIDASERIITIKPHLTHDYHSALTFTIQHYISDSDLSSGSNYIGVQIWGTESNNYANRMTLSAIYNRQ
jgi:hypothetical protein